MNNSHSQEKTLSKNTFPSSVFVNRSKQIDQLDKYLTNACDGRGNFILINGEEGNGKSSLVKYFKEKIVDQRATFMEMRFSAEDGIDPYIPFTRLINKLKQVNQSEKNDNGNFDKDSPELSKDLTTEFNMEMLHNIQSSSALIQQRIVSSLFEYTHSKPLVIFVANIHLANQSAWQFFHYLADKIREEKILFVATLRQDGREILNEKKPVYSDILSRMNRDGFLQKMTLERFSLQELKTLLHEIFKKTDFSGDFISMLFEVSGGIPAQIIKYLKLLLDSHQLYEVNNIWFNASDIDKEKLIQDTLYTGDMEKIKHDFGQFSQDQQKLLKYASLINGSFSYELLALITNQNKIETIKELKKIGENKFIIESGSDTYNFKKSELKIAINSLITDARQQEMHYEIADKIKESKLFKNEDSAYRLAHHYSKSNDPHKSVKYLVEAGDYSIQKLAFVEAKDFYQEAVVHLAEKPSDKKEYARLYIQLSWLDRVLGKYEDAISICDKAHQIFGASEKDKIANLIRIQKAFTYFRLSNWKLSKENLEVCLNNIDVMGTFEKATIHFGIGNIHFELCEYDKAKGHYTDGLNYASEMGASSLVALIYNHLGMVENITGNPMKAIALYSKAIPVYKETGNSSGLAQVYHNIGLTYADDRNWEEANRFCGKSLSVSGMIGLTPLKSITFLNKAMALTQLNRLNEAHEYNFKAIRLLKFLNDELGVAEYHKIQGMLEAKEQNWNDAMENFNLAINKFKQFENKLGYAETLIEKGSTEIEMNKKDEAIISLKEAISILTDMDATKKAKYTEQLLNELNEQELLV